MAERQAPAVITFFDITHWAYFKPRGKKAVLHSCSDVLGELREFAKSKIIGETSTFELAEGAEEHQVYLLGVAENDGDFLVATWNEHEGDGSIGLLDKAAKVAAPKVSEEKVGPNQSPGFPAYFWIIPELHLLATVKFSGGPSTGVPGLKRYAEGFMRTRSPMVRMSGSKILGYGPSSEELVPRVRMNLLTRVVADAELTPRWKQVIKIVRRETLRISVEQERDLFEKLLARLHLAERVSLAQQEFAFSYEVDFEPQSEAEMASAIKNFHEQRGLHGVSWGRMGFRIREGAGSKVYWTNRQHVRETADLQFATIDSTRVAEPASVLSALKANRAKFLAAALEARR